jgi:hypothetical protein
MQAEERRWMVYGLKPRDELLGVVEAGTPEEAIGAARGRWPAETKLCVGRMPKSGG